MFYHDTEVWLSQAKYVFNRLQITSNLENYRTFEPIIGPIFTIFAP
jgi:hypothetical protein